MALDNSNACIGYKLAFYRYMYSIDIYRTINFSIKQLSGSNINDEQIAIVNNLSTLLSVRSGNNYINDFTLIEVNDLISFFIHNVENVISQLYVLLIMYNCANLLSYSFYIESSFLLLFILHFICLVYHMCMNEINNNNDILQNNCEYAPLSERDKTQLPHEHRIQSVLQW